MSCGQNKYGKIKKDGLSYNITAEDYSTDLLIKGIDVSCSGCEGKFIFCEPKNIRPYFRHESKSKTTWHGDWQNCFQKENREITFITENSICRADISVAEINLIIEFQHSAISDEEISQRENQYKNNLNKKLIWILDGENLGFYEIGDKFILDLKHITNINKFLQIESVDHFYIDYKDQYEKETYVYRIQKQNVRNGTIRVSERCSRKDFVNNIKNGKEIEKEKYIPSVLTRKQRGAGCGKTFESVNTLPKEIKDNKKRTIFFLTKMHSAKYVIYEELQNQIQKYEDFKNLNLEDKTYEENGKEKTKQYVYKGNYMGENVLITIGTIDSFMFAVLNNSERCEENTCKDRLEINFFKGILNNIDKNVEDIKKIEYSSNTSILNCNSLIIVDEAQDLGLDYLSALDKIGNLTGTDISVIGDKLQSIFCAKNIMTEQKLDNYFMNIKDETKEDMVMQRFRNKNLMELVNNVVPFQSFGLKKIERISEGNDDYDQKVEYLPNISCYNYNKIIKECIKIMKEYEDTEPEDFMFILPFVNKNNLIEPLKIAIENFWRKKKSKFQHNLDTLFVVAHKSEENKPIDLSTSKEKTSIQSIHSSKGTGREIVFILGLSEKSLKRFSEDYDDEEDEKLIFESLLHVALTRAKSCMYISFQDGHDDNIIKRFMAFNDSISPYENIFPKHNKKFCPRHIIQNGDLGLIEHMAKNHKEKLIFEYDKNNILVDWSHHIIRYGILQLMLYLNMKYNSSDKNKRKCLEFNNISNLIISEEDTATEYRDKITKYFGELRNKQITTGTYQKVDKVFLFKNGYTAQYENVKKSMENIIKKFQQFFTMRSADDNKTFYEEGSGLNFIKKFSQLDFCVFYFLERWVTLREYSPIELTTIYEISTFLHGNNDKIAEFYDSIPSIWNIFINIFSELKNKDNVNYRPSENIQFGGYNNDATFIFRDCINSAWNENTFYNFKICPSFSKININTVLYEVILQSYIINYNNPKNHKIETYIISTNKDYKITIDCNSLSNEDKNKITKTIHAYLKEKENNYISYLRKYYSGWKFDKIRDDLAGKSDIIPRYVSSSFRQNENIFWKKCKDIMEQEIDNLFQIIES
jgi:hypothetical protein